MRNGLKTPIPDFSRCRRRDSFRRRFSGAASSATKYGVLQEGVQVEQERHFRTVGFFGRATGYQLWIGQGFESPAGAG